ncbi:MAG TPA: hypothetical protein VEH31_40135 [Streptosporangiaceae bacterium]|nr:hypothetical protein [Streptosporangiaceae bacterium]
MSVATSARNGAIRVPDTRLFTKLRGHRGRSIRMKPGTMSKKKPIVTPIPARIEPSSSPR